MKKVLLFLLLFSSTETILAADYNNIPLYPSTNFRSTDAYTLSRANVVEPITYAYENLALNAAYALSQKCSCDVVVTPPILTFKTTWIKAPVSSSSSKSSSSTIKVSSSSSSSKSSSSISSVTKNSSSSSAVQIVGLITPTFIKASSDYGMNLISNTIDGDAATRWESSWNTDLTNIVLDYGTTKTFSKLEIDWEAANAKDYTVFGSNDLTSWTALASKTNGVFGDRTDVLNISGNYQYIKLNFTLRSVNNDWGYSIYEIRSYGNVDSSAARSSSSYASSSKPSNLVAKDLLWYAPTKRLDGTDLKFSEIGGYTLIQVSATGEVIKSWSIPASSSDPVTYSVFLDLASTDILKINAFDTSGYYSSYVVIN